MPEDCVGNYSAESSDHWIENELREIEHLKCDDRANRTNLLASEYGKRFENLIYKIFR